MLKCLYGYDVLSCKWFFSNAANHPGESDVHTSDRSAMRPVDLPADESRFPYVRVKMDAKQSIAQSTPKKTQKGEFSAS